MRKPARKAGSRERVANGTRTRDHRDHNPGLYQLSYRHRAAPMVSALRRGGAIDAPGRIRTSDQRLRRPSLCPLSYGRLAEGYSGLSEPR
jgi:hypothetical protein